MKHSSLHFLSSMIFAFAVTSAAFAGPYPGASFNQVRAVIYDNSSMPADLDSSEVSDVKSEQAIYKAGQLPQYETTLSKVLGFGWMSLTGFLPLALRARETVSDVIDYYPRLDKIIHSNGICLMGTWSITEPSPYSGYFAQGKKGLFIGRASTALSETTTNGQRAFGFAGKLFPTMDPNAVVRTASIFTVDDLGGTKAKHFLDVGLTNQPPIGFTLDPEESLLGIEIAKSLLTISEPNIGFRPVWQVSHAGLTNAEKASAKTPKWIQIRASSGQTKIDAVDFRDELVISKYPDKKIKLDILVSNVTKNAAELAKWSRLGRIELTESSVSYGCDRRLHFSHPRENP
jgi:hypothetical protein